MNESVEEQNSGFNIEGYQGPATCESPVESEHLGAPGQQRLQSEGSRFVQEGEGERQEALQAESEQDQQAEERLGVLQGFARQPEGDYSYPATDRVVDWNTDQNTTHLHIMKVFLIIFISLVAHCNV